MEKKVNKKTTSVKKSETKVEKNNPTESKNASMGKTQLMLSVILVLVILQFILSISLAISNDESNTNSNVDSRIGNIENKVNAIDNFFRTNVQGYDAEGNSEGTTAKVEKIEISADDDPWIGGENAKVEVIEFSDYQCPFCRKYWAESYPQLKKDYIDTGKVKYVFRDFPLNFHPVAIPAAIAGNCIRDQKGNEAYFEYHDISLSEQEKLGQGTIQYTEEDIMSWVSNFDLDMDKFNTCYNDPAQKTEIEADLADGSKAGVSGTPSFFINGELIVGAQPYSVIKAAIDKALAETE